MVELPENQPPKSKSPQDELDELLRQSDMARPTSGIKLPEAAIRRRVNWLGIGVVALAVALVTGTGVFLLRGVQFSTGELVFELNEDQVQLTVDGRAYGQISSGSIVRLKVGERTLTLNKDGFLELTERVEVSRNQQLAVNLQLLPTPVIEQVLEQPVEFIRLNQDGSEISFWDRQSGGFKSINLETRQVADLFRGSFAGVRDVAWSPTGQAAMVKLDGRPGLTNMLDNRQVPGRYVPLGERPVQGQPKFDGSTTWLFDDNRKTAAGWQPILLTESVRQVALNSRGDMVVYIYETADGEYSLVQAWPDGLEWERWIVDMPRLTDPKFFWGPDDRYLLIWDAGKLSVLDLVAKTLQEPFADYLPGSQFAFSTDGIKVAYLSNEAEGRLKVYDLASGATQTVEGLAVAPSAGVAGVGPNSFIVTLDSQGFMLVDLLRNVRTPIPFVGNESALSVQRLEYSLAGKVLMLVGESGVFIMRV